MLIISIEKNKFADFVYKQLSAFLPDGDNINRVLFGALVDKALQRTEFCFSRIGNKYYQKEGKSFFHHLNSDQYAIFLYYLANTVWKERQDINLASKIYCLNKALHAVDIYYEVEMPDIFQLVHPVGTVLGRAHYSDYFISYQRVTIGANTDNEYPTIGESVVVYGGSMIIGKTCIGSNCQVAAGTVIMNADIPDNQVVFGRYPNTQFKPTAKKVKERFFK